MTSFRPVDSKREEFRKYLEKSGAMDALTKVLVMLYDEPEKPADALDYVRKHLGDTRPDEKELEILKTDLEAATIKIQSLQDEIQVLKEKLQKYEPLEEVTPMQENGDPAHSSVAGDLHTATSDSRPTPTVVSASPTVTSARPKSTVEAEHADAVPVQEL